MKHQDFLSYAIYMVGFIGFPLCSCSKDSLKNDIHGIELDDRIVEIQRTKSIDSDNLIKMGKVDAIQRINEKMPTIIVSGGIVQKVPGLDNIEYDRNRYEFKYLPTNCSDADFAKLWKYSESFNSTMLKR